MLADTLKKLTRRHKQPRPVRSWLGLETLENRVVPASTVDFGPLRFVGDALNSTNGHTYTAESGLVSIGYLPVGTATFLPLVQVVVSGPENSNQDGKLVLDTNDVSQFTITEGTIQAVIQGGTPSTLWSTPSGSTAAVVFKTADLVGGGGATLDATNSATLAVAGVNFVPSSLGFSRPAPGDDRVQLQGAVNFKKLDAHGDFFNVQAAVNGSNYVLYETTGVSLTGLTGTVSVNGHIGSVLVSGSLSLGYSQPDSFTFGGGVTISTQEQGTANKRALDGVGVTMQMTIDQGALQQVAATVTGAFNIFALNVSFDAGDPPGFSYDANTKDWQVWGEVKASIKGNDLQVQMGNAASPGILIQNGRLQSLNATVTSDFSLFSASFDISNLTFVYNTDPTKEQFELYGGTVKLRIPIKGVPEDITVGFGDQLTPGLVFKAGQLQSINLSLTGDINLGKVALRPRAAAVHWFVDPTDGEDKFLVSGGVEFDFFKFQASVTLGTAAAPGLIIHDGHFDIDDLDIKVGNLPFGVFTVQNLEVHFTKGTTPDDSDFDLFVDLDLQFPMGWSIDASITFVDGKFDGFSLAYDAGSSFGLELFDTGLFVTHIDASVKNLEHPENFVITGGFDIVFGKQVRILGKDAVIFRAHGDIKLDKDEFILEGDAELGAYLIRPGDGINPAVWGNVMGAGSIKVDCNWATKTYTAYLEVDGLLAGLFSFEADFFFKVGQDIRFLAEGFVTVPPVIPFIGGEKLGGVGLFFEHVWAHDAIPATTTFAAWVELDVFVKFEVGFEVLLDAVGTHVQLIGHKAIDGFKTPPAPPPPPVEQTYTFTSNYTQNVPASATSLTLAMDWGKANPNAKIVGTPVVSIKRLSDGRVFTEAEFTAANNLALVTNASVSSLTSKTVHIVGSSTDGFVPIADQYQLIVQITADGENPYPDYTTAPFTAAYHVPPPIINALTVPASPRDAFPLTLTGKIDGAFLDQAEVSVFLAAADDPTKQGSLVGKSKLTAVQGPDANWQATVSVPLDDLFPSNYYVYAILNPQPDTTSPDLQGGYNPTPLQSSPSGAFIPVPAVYGSAANQAFEVMTGWTVYLDYNQNGQQDPGEPGRTTNPDGFYSFYPTGRAGENPVPVGTPFDVRLVPLTDNFVLPVDHVTVTYDGSTSLPVNFSVKEKSAIKGTVFEDQNQSGHQAGQPTVGNVVAYIDANHNGQRDPGEDTAVTSTNGEYVFTQRQPGTYTVALDVNSFVFGAVTTSYVVPSSTTGKSTPRVAYGMDFDVTQLLQITSLGAFDSGGDGFHQVITATLYDRMTRQAVATIDFSPADPGLLAGGSRFKPLPIPIELPRGFQGTIVGEGYGGADLAGDYFFQPVTWTTDGQGGALAFVGTGRYGDTLGVFPLVVDAAKVPNAYAAGTFQFRTAPPWYQTSPAGSYTVTIDASGFDVVGARDFGAEPFSTISGAITGHPLAGAEHLDPTAGPLSGWTVQLLNGTNQVVATTTTAADGTYLFDRARPGDYTVKEVVPAGWRELSPFASDLQFQQTSGLVLDYPTTALAVADFNRDGYLDVVLTSAAPDNFLMLAYGHGDGTFGIQGQDVILGSAGHPIGVEVCDVNNDGWVDLVVYNAEPDDQSQSNVIAIYNTKSSDPTKQFDIDNSDFWPMPLLGVFTDMVSADFNEDGLVDLLVAYGTVGNLRAGYAVFLNNADASQRTAQGFPFAGPDGAYASGGAVVADLNQDGHADVFLNSGRQMVDATLTTILYGPYNGGFDLRSVGQLVNQGPVAWSPVGPADPGSVVLVGNLALGDRQAERLSYLSVDNPSSAVSVAPPGHFLAGLALEDFDGDLKTDLAVLANSYLQSAGLNGLAVYLSTPGSFLPGARHDFPTPTDLEHSPAGLVAADVNNDGLVDLVMADQVNYELTVFLNTSVQNLAGLRVTAPYGGHATGNDFVNVSTSTGATVEGVIYDDVNRNGARETGESGRAGRFVFVDGNRNGRYDAGEPSTVTVAGGAYSLPVLAAGTYAVGVFPEADWKRHEAASEFAEATVDSDTSARIDFGRVRRLIRPPTNVIVEQGESVRLSVSLTADAAGRSLAFSLEPGSPAGVGIDPVTGVLTWVGAGRQGPGTYSVGVRVRDAFAPLFTDVERVTITVAPVANEVREVRELYRDLLNRDADPAGQDAWVNLLRSGWTREQVARSIRASAEYLGLQVDAFYAAYLHRAADAAGRAVWVSLWQSGASETDVAWALLISSEYQNAHADTTSFLFALYADVLGRAPDEAGLASWQTAAANGQGRSAIALGFLRSPEASARFLRPATA